MDRSRNQQHLTCGPPTFQLRVRFRCRRQRELAANVHLERSIGNPPENGAGTLDQLSPARYIVPGSGTSEEERALLAEQLGIDWCNWTARLSEEHEHAPWSQAPQTLRERRLSHRVVHHMHPGPARQASGLALEILLGIEDDFMRPCRSRQGCLGLGRHG